MWHFVGRPSQICLASVISTVVYVKLLENPLCVVLVLRTLLAQMFYRNVLCSVMPGNGSNVIVWIFFKLLEVNIKLVWVVPVHS